MLVRWFFNFKGHQLRTIEIEGAPWFHATDLCKCVELTTAKGTFMHLKKVDDEERRIITPNQIGGLRGKGATFVSESGLYRLIMRADGAAAKPFRDWVVRDVLPSIRRTGGYLLNEDARQTAHADELQAMPLPAEIMQGVEVCR